MSVRFQRANFLVSDMRAALRFYVDVLGMEVAFRKADRDKSYSHTVFGIDPANAVGFAALSAPSQPRVMALTEVPGLEEQAAPRRSAIVLEVEDVDAVVARARRGGYRVFPEERLVTHDGRTGREVGLLDADGNLTVIYRILAAAPGRAATRPTPSPASSAPARTRRSTPSAPPARSAPSELPARSAPSIPSAPPARSVCSPEPGPA